MDLLTKGLVQFLLSWEPARQKPYSPSFDQRTNGYIEMALRCKAMFFTQFNELKQIRMNGDRIFPSRFVDLHEL